MKYRLSTILLLITCVALALGWYVDRHKRNTEQLVLGASTWQQSAYLQSFDTDNLAELVEKVETKQILGLFYLFSSAESLRQFNRSELGVLDRRYSPQSFAVGLLKALHCSTSDQYFDRLKLLDPEGDFADYEPGGEHYKEFRQFIEEALQAKEQTRLNPP